MIRWPSNTTGYCFLIYTQGLQRERGWWGGEEERHIKKRGSALLYPPTQGPPLLYHPGRQPRKQDSVFIWHGGGGSPVLA